MESGEPGSFEQLLPAAGRLVRRPRDAQRRRSERLLPRHHQPRAGRARARGERWRRRARRPGACRSSARPSARLAGTLELDELLRILGDVVLNGFGEGSWSRSRARSRRVAQAGEPGGAALPRRARPARCRWRAGRASVAGGRRFGARTAVPRAAPGARRRRLGERPALALPLVSRGRMLGAVVVIGAGRERARPARAGRARGARRRGARQRGPVRRRAAARAHAPALAAADGAAVAARDRPRRALPARAPAAATSAATSTSGTRSRTAGCCW